VRWETVGSNGKSLGEYRVAKNKVNDEWKYQLFYKNERLGIYQSFDECKTIAKTHQNALSEAITS
jgi:hypothetical protein